MKKMIYVFISITILLFLSSCTTNWTASYTGDYCADNLQDRTETDVDCGGLYCDPCETETYDATTAADTVTEYTLADWPEMFIEDDEWTALLVVGDDARAEDVIAVTNVGKSIQLINVEEETTPEDGETIPISVTAVSLASEIDDLYAQDLILIGTQCYNDLINEVLGYDENTCSESIQDEDTAIIKLLVTDSNKILIISGYSGTDTRYAGTFMSEEAYYSLLEGAEVVIDTSDKDSLSILSIAN